MQKPGQARGAAKHLKVSRGAGGGLETVRKDFAATQRLVDGRFFCWSCCRAGEGWKSHWMLPRRGHSQKGHSNLERPLDAAGRDAKLMA